MANKRKSKSSVPRHKRLDRHGRLQAAKHWFPKYVGKNLVQGYKKRFGVSLECAIRELEVLGIELDQKYIKQVRQSEEARLRNRRERKLRMVNDMEDDSSIDSTFCFIAGHTENGFPYGTTWEEEKRNREKLADQRERDSLGEKLDDLVKGTNETKCSFNFTDIRNGSVYSRPYH